MPHADINGARLYFEDTGGAKPAVLFTHGIFFSSAMFAPQFDALKSDYRCIGLDWRGQGKSEMTLEFTNVLPAFGVNDSSKTIAPISNAISLTSR